MSATLPLPTPINPGDIGTGLDDIETDFGGPAPTETEPAPGQGFHEALANAIRARFDGLAAQPLELPTVYSNLKGAADSDGLDGISDPPSDGPWAVVTILDGESNQVELSTGVTGAGPRTRTIGRMIVNVYTPIDTGDRTARQLCDWIKLAFKQISANGITWRTPAVLDIGRAHQSWWQFNVSCPFYADEIS